MTEAKKYYWLKLKSDFFTSKRIKKLRKVAGGDTYTIIYLKMQLSAIKTDGILQWTGVEDNFAAELALDLDENVEDVQMTLGFLLTNGLIETIDSKNYFLPYAVENTGKEGSSAERVRAFREREKAKLLQCNTDVTSCNTEIEKEIEKDIEQEIEKPKRKRFAPPTVEEVKAYCNESKYKIDAERFIAHYSSNGWMVGKNKMKDWQAAVRNWWLRDNESKAPKKQPERSFKPTEF